MRGTNPIHALAISACLGIGLAGNAFAYVHAPVFSPQPLIPGQDVSMSLRYGDCDIFGEYPVDPTAFPRLTRVGSTIRYELFGVHHQPGTLSCVTPDSTATFNLGSFPEGTYSFELVRASPLPDGFEYETVSTTQIVVGNGIAEAVPLPVDNVMALAALILALGIFATVSVRRSADLE
jgi:hypothetical protein